jgi:hypothetical protein
MLECAKDLVFRNDLGIFYSNRILSLVLILVTHMKESKRNNPQAHGYR